MATRNPGVSKKIEAALRACLGIISSIALIFALTPSCAFGYSPGSPDCSSGEPLVSNKDAKDDFSPHSDLSDSNNNQFDDDSCQIVGTRYLEEDDYSPSTSINLFSLNVLSDDSVVRLKDETAVKWFDRVEFPDEFEDDCKGFYNRLIEASDNDGDRDFLIEDRYLNPVEEPVPNEFVSFSKNGYTAIRVGSFKGSSDSEIEEKLDALYECAFVVRAAFDRDHPEVFWINGGALFFGAVSSKPDSSGNLTGTVYLTIGGYSNLDDESTHDDIRIPDFSSEEVIKSTIELRDRRVKELLNEVNTVYSDAEKVRFFNKWLTCSNSYNNQGIANLSNTYPLAFECISSLIGRAQGEGPVCEGYARAFKVLCDASGIPCTLTDGNANGKHMWNYVQVGGKWYAIDVTWNDPGTATEVRSGSERENYFLLGDKIFDDHSVENVHFKGGFEFGSGPILEKDSYNVAQFSEIYKNYFSKFDSSKYFTTDLDLTKMDTYMGFCLISTLPSATYTSKEIRIYPKSVVLNGRLLGLDTNYRVTYSNNINAGTAHMTVSGLGDYYGSKTASFEINPAPISVTSMSLKSSTVTYSGKALLPDVIVKMGDPAYKQNVDYIIGKTYSNNIAAGLGSVSVTVKGVGNYAGTVSHALNFKIYPKKASLKKLTAKKKAMVVKWNKATSAWGTGYQIRYSTNSKFKSGVKNTNVKKVTTAQTTIKKLKSKKRYYVSIRVYKTVNGTKYYGAWSASKKIKVK